MQNVRAYGEGKKRVPLIGRSRWGERGYDGSGCGR